MSGAYDTEFAEAVRKCGITLTPHRTNGEYRGGDMLAKFLRSDYPLTNAERELLAQLVTGEFQRPKGKPPLGVGVAHIVETVKHFDECEESGDFEKVALGKAQKFLKKTYNKKVSDSQLRAWIAETKKRKEKIPPK